MKKIGLIFSFMISFISFSQEGEIELTDENLGQSFAKNVQLIEDPAGELTLEEVLALPDDQFKNPKNIIPNLDFTTSTWWIRFSVKNSSSSAHFILETGRPITNEVEFFQMRGSNVENHYKSGDDYLYDEKVIPHRKNLFPIVMYPGQKKNYCVRLKSDGEVISLPVRISDRLSFFEKDAKSQFSYGFYYGLMCLVIIIYFFFFILLKDRAFFFYIAYVGAQALMQFTLDGYAFIHLFPSGGYLANHFVVFSAGTTIVVLLLYVSNFLNLKEKNPLMKKVFLVCQVLVILTILLSLIPGTTYVISYPVINGVSLVSIILSVVAIYRLKYKGHKVDNFFAIAFTVLITGAVIFILGNFNIIGNAEIAQAALKISSALEVAILSISMSNKYRALQKDKEEAQKIAMKSLEEQNALVEGMNVKLEAQVKERTAEIQHQKEELAEINQEIVSSIQYAKRIQEAILPQDEQVRQMLPESLIFYRPKDVVSGDFYFVDKTTTNNGLGLVLFAAVDCTGHGVPGAFMSIVGSNYLNQALTEPKVNSPAEALNFLNVGVNHSLRQDVNTTVTTVRDGMDIALCGYDKSTKQIHFAGAKNPIYIIRKADSLEELGFDFENERDPLKDADQPLYLQEIKGDSHPIGAYVGDKLKPFTDHTIQLQTGDMIYVFSDGYADQFGGPDGKKYKYKTFKKFLLKISQLPVEEQKRLLIEEYDNWKGGYEQIDDVLVMGIRIE
ncbi:MAG: 7TM diverse intracellular signaling domain-containing protein [Crocinitomicaceae bacterium]